MEQMKYVETNQVDGITGTRTNGWNQFKQRMQIEYVETEEIGATMDSIDTQQMSADHRITDHALFADSGNRARTVVACPIPSRLTFIEACPHSQVMDMIWSAIAAA
jgi:hypothetical protein